jgi:hypothetical protein
MVHNNLITIQDRKNVKNSFRFLTGGTSGLMLHIGLPIKRHPEGTNDRLLTINDQAGKN